MFLFSTFVGCLFFIQFFSYKYFKNYSRLRYIGVCELDSHRHTDICGIKQPRAQYTRHDDIEEPFFRWKKNSTRTKIDCRRFFCLYQFKHTTKHYVLSLIFFFLLFLSILTSCCVAFNAKRIAITLVIYLIFVRMYWTYWLAGYDFLFVSHVEVFVWIVCEK